MKQTPVESSAIKSIGYKNNHLRVQWLSGGWVAHDDVPEAAFMKLLTAESVGTEYNDAIRNKFPKSEELDG